MIGHRNSWSSDLVCFHSQLLRIRPSEDSFLTSAERWTADRIAATCDDIPADGTGLVVDDSSVV